MKKKLPLIIGIIVIGILCGVGIAVYMYNKPHRNIENATADFTLKAADFVAEYTGDEEAANLKYLGKVICVEGDIIDKKVEPNGIAEFTLIDSYEGLTASFDSTYVVNNYDLLNSYEPGQIIKIKGKCDGYQMLRGVSLTKSSIDK